MPSLELRLLGLFQATLEGRALHGFRSLKVRALLAYLALEPGRRHSREKLATLLWSEHPTRSALLSLRVALSNLRQVLPAHVSGQQDPPFLSITREGVSLAPWHADCWVDAAEFDSLVAKSHNHTHRALARCRACAERLARAVDLYRGDLLADIVLPDSPAFDDWRLIEMEMRR